MDRRRVLFISTHTAARARLAAGLLRGLGGDRFAAASASTGSTAADPLVARALGELGIDPAGPPAAPLDRYLGRRFDDAIVFCAGAGET